ncbi:Alpha/Beta hydrolase protein [Chytridium lagenaria]|nr:Alpha/Beta hydrolase protein [Chytridium lagenaria]
MQILTIITKVLLIAGLVSVNGAPAPRPGGGAEPAYKPPTGPNIKTVPDARVDQLRSLAQISQLAYCENPVIQARTCIICNGPVKDFTNVLTITSSDNNTRGYMALDTSRRTIYLSFQGSANAQNWVTNLDAVRTSLDISMMDPKSSYASLASSASVHSGFQKAYARVRSQVRSSLTTLLRQQPDASLHATGHSLGCSLTQLAVVDLIMAKQLPPNRITITGFGCPRVGNYEFARLLDTQLGVSSVTRVVHSADLVPRVPPTPLGYRHAGTENWIDVTVKKMFECGDSKQGLDESPSCVNNVNEFDLNTRSHSSYWINTGSENVCNTVPRNSVAVNPFPVKYLPFEVNTSG